MPSESITLMINLDMVGRIVDDALSINGTGTGTGLDALVRQATDGSTLDVRLPDGLTSRSDHAEFYRQGVPVLFFSESIFPDEYHTPADDSWLINVTDGAEASRLLAKTALAAATHDGKIEHRVIDGFETGDGGPALSEIRIRFGIKPGNYGELEAGVAIGGISPGTSAEEAGLLAGDRLISWNGETIQGVREWMGMMVGHEPGDIVTVGVVRDGETLEIPVMLKARD